MGVGEGSTPATPVGNQWFLLHNLRLLGREGQESSTGPSCGLITLTHPQETPAYRKLTHHADRRWQDTEGHSATGSLFTPPPHRSNWKANGTQTPGEECLDSCTLPQ